MARMPAIGTSTDWLTPAKRALKRTNSLPSSSCATARAATLSTTRPSFTALRGTFTPGADASTSMYGVRPLSLIQSYIARNRYERFDDMLMEVVIGTRAASRTQRFLLWREAACEA